MTLFSTDADVEPTYLDIIDISAGYGVMSALIDGLLPGDVVQMVSLEVSPASGGAAIINLEIDMVQRTSGFFSWVSQSAIYAHFTLTAANIVTIAAGAYRYSVVLSVLRNGMTLTREVQAGVIAGRTSASPTPPLIVANLVMVGGPVVGGIGQTAQLSAIAYDGLGNIIPTADIAWDSGDALVAQVDASGLVSFLTPGVTTIYAESMGIQASTTATSNDPAFVAPSNMQVAGWLTSDNAWNPHTLTAEWIQPGTFGGNSSSTYTVPGTLAALHFAGDGAALTGLPAAAVTGLLPVAHGGTGVATLTAGNLLVGAGTSAMTALAPGAAAGFVRSNGTTWTRAAIITTDVSDLTTAATGITKLGTINTGVWNGTSIATGFTDAKIKTVTGTTARLAIGGTSTDPTFDIDAAYVGQASITTLGTITTGVWHGSSIAVTFTDAKVASVTGVTNRTTISGTAGSPIVDIAAGYVGQGTITTLGTISSGTWQGGVIGTTYTTAQVITVAGTGARVTIGGTATNPTIDIAAGYAGQASITTLGTIATGVWQGTAVADAYLAALSASKLTGTALPNAIVQSALTSVGVISAGTWQGTAVADAYLAALSATKLTGTTLAATVVNSSLTGVGTIGTGVWQGTAIANGFIASGIDVAKLTVGTTLPATIVTSSLTTVGTIAAGTWHGAVIGPTYGGTGVNNGAATLTLGGNVTISGAFTATITITGNTTVTLPTTGTLLTTTATSLPGLVTVGTITTGVWNGTAIANAFIASGLDVTKLTVGATLPSNVTGSSLTSVGTIAAGTWQGTAIAAAYTVAQVVSVAGVSNRTTIGGTSANPTVDISAAYVGQASITTLGTVTSGAWNATTIATNKGGTGLTGYTLGDVLYASNSTTLTQLAGNITTSKRFLIQTGTGSVSAAPSWGQVATADISDITSAATGITSVGTIATGVWQGTIVSSTYGGTGANNAGRTITIGGNLTTAGAFTTTLTVTGNTSVTLPTTGTLITSSVTTLSSLVSVGTITTGVWNGTAIANGFIASGLDVTKLTAGTTLPSNVTASSLTSVGVLAAPHMTAAVVDSGGISVAAGNVGVGTGALNAAVGINVTSTALTGTSQYGIQSNPAFSSGASVAGYGLAIACTTAATGFTMANLYNIRIFDAVEGAGSTVTTQYGVYIASMTAGNTNYAIFTNVGLVRFGDAVTVASGSLTMATGNVVLQADGAEVSTTTAGITTTRFKTDASGGLISVDGTNALRLRSNGIDRLSVVAGTGAIAISGAFTVAGASSFASAVTISAGGLNVTGGITIAGSSLAISGGASITGTVPFTGSVTVAGTLGVTGNVALGGTLSILGSTLKYLSGNATTVTIGNDDTGGIITMRTEGVNRVSVSTATTAISNAVTMASTLGVTGTATFAAAQFTGAANSVVVGSQTLGSSLTPGTNNTFDLGAGSFQWRNLFVATTATVGGLVVGASGATFAGLTEVSLSAAAAIYRLTSVGGSGRSWDLRSNTSGLFGVTDVTGGVTRMTIDAAGVFTVTGLLTTTASAAASAGLRLPHGAAPTSPVNGDVWTTTAGMFVRINGATVGPLT